MKPSKTALAKVPRAKANRQSSKARLDAIPVEEQIETLRERFAISKTPTQFGLAIEAKLEQFLR